MIKEQTDINITKIREDETLTKEKKQELIDAALELEMIPIRKENDKAILQGISFLIAICGGIWAVKAWVLPALLI